MSQPSRQIVILCEGDSEVYCVKRFLQPRWREKFGTSIVLKPINLYAKIKKIGKRTPMHLQDKRILAVFTLIDLYRAPIKCNQKSSLAEKVQQLKDHLRSLVSKEYHKTFHPCIAVHELEGWLLADKEALAQYLHYNKLPKWQEPEKINFQKPPSVRIKDLFQKHLKRRYGKGTDAAILFGKAGFERIYDKCPHFREFWDTLCKVAEHRTVRDTNR